MSSDKLLVRVGSWVGKVTASLLLLLPSTESDREMRAIVNKVEDTNLMKVDYFGEVAKLSPLPLPPLAAFIPPTRSTWNPPSLTKSTIELFPRKWPMYVTEKRRRDT